VGLINVKDMQTAGPLELGKLLQTLDPSFNFSSTFISDGTDTIRPATLRGWARTSCWCWSTASAATAGAGQRAATPGPRLGAAPT
jgi:hypothetical protein